MTLRASLLIAMALLAACTKPQTGGVKADNSLVRLIPSDTQQLAGVRLDLVRETPIYKKYGARAVPMLDNLTREAGLDPTKDVDEVLTAANGMGGITMVRGRFASPDFKKNLERSGGQAVLLDANTLVVGSPAMVTWTKTAKGGGVPPALSKLMQEIPPGPHVWAVSSGGSLPIDLPKEGNAANLARVFSSLSSVVLWADLSRGIKLGSIGHVKDEPAAKQLEGGLRALIGLGRLSAGTNQKDLLSAFDMIQITRDTSTVKMSADLAMDQIDALSGVLDSKMGQQGGRF